MAIIQPGAGTQIAMETVRPNPSQEWKAIQADPEGCRQAILDCGRSIGWPELGIHPLRLPAGYEGWKTAIDSWPPLWLLTAWETIDKAIRHWEQQNERTGRIHPSAFTHLDFGPGRTCEDCGADLPVYRVVRCDGCIGRDWERLEETAPDRLGRIEPNTAAQPATPPASTPKKKPARRPLPVTA